MKSSGSDFIAASLLAVLLLSACAGRMPVPGGNEASNIAWYKSEEDMKTHLSALRPGMTEDDAFSVLEHGREELIRLDRRDIRIALLGGENAPVPDSLTRYGPDLMQSLYGYRFYYKKVKREHGFTSPVRIRTDESGFRYSVTLIFLGGILFENPILSGGIVNDSDSNTLFDYITPGTIVDHAVP